MLYFFWLPQSNKYFPSLFYKYLLIKNFDGLSHAFTHHFTATISYIVLKVFLDSTIFLDTSKDTYLVAQIVFFFYLVLLRLNFTLSWY